MDPISAPLGCRTKLNALLRMAGTTGLEPATSAVTGQRSNQLSYVPSLLLGGWKTFLQADAQCIEVSSSMSNPSRYCICDRPG